ncbi:hypothetical protein BTA51_16275 [Hahella sp. CCB-MM4]|nr:hypothetical protein BTA51_16275 [Hahella sp. CCB-MM4]
MSPVLYADDGFWNPAKSDRLEHTFPYFSVELDLPSLREYLKQAPAEGAPQGLSLKLPMPDQSFVVLEAYDSPVMAPELAAKYPLIRTYKVKGVDIPTMSGRIDLTDAGFKAFLTTQGKSVLIEPEAVFGGSNKMQSEGAGKGRYRVFYKQDLPNIPKPVEPPGELRPEPSQDNADNAEEGQQGFFSRLWRSVKRWF